MIFGLAVKMLSSYFKMLGLELQLQLPPADPGSQEWCSSNWVPAVPVEEFSAPRPAPAAEGIHLRSEPAVGAFLLCACLSVSLRNNNKNTQKRRSSSTVKVKVCPGYQHPGTERKKEAFSLWRWEERRWDTESKGRMKPIWASPETTRMGTGNICHGGKGRNPSCPSSFHGLGPYLES